MDSHCEILWADNLGAGSGCQPTADYGAGLYATAKQELIAQRCLTSKIISLWINNSLTKYVKHKLRAYKTSYVYNSQDDGSEFFSLLKKLRALTHDQDDKTST